MAQYGSILVLAEADNAEVSTNSLRVLSKAREIAEAIGARVEIAITASKATAESLIRYGADVVHYSENDFGFDYQALANALSKLIADIKPRAIIASASEAGNSVAAFLGASFGSAPVFECSNLELDADSELIATKAIYQGRFLVQIASRKPHIFTLFTKNLPLPFEDPSRYGKLVEFQAEAKKSISIISESTYERQESRISIVAGRQLKDAENFSMLEKLAESMGAKVYATITAVDAGIAKEGYAIKPSEEISSEVCITIGVGEAKDDLLNINSKTIIAIEKEQDAPAVKIAKIAMIGEPAELVRHWLEL